MALSWSSISLAIAAVSGSVLAQPCEPYWAGVGPSVRSTHELGSLAVFDDGSGLKLFASGRVAPEVPVVGGTDQVMRWDGRSWDVISQGLPTNAPGAPPGPKTVLRVFQFASGPRLYASSSYYDTASVRHVRGFYWDGDQWVPDPEEMHVSGNPLLVHDDGSGEAIYGRVPLNLSNDPRGVGRWTGTHWDVIGITNNTILRMIVYDDGKGPHLHITGYFNTVSGTSALGIARWTGSAWQALGAGLVQPSRAEIVHDDGTGPALYVANVRNAGGAPVNWIARWDGQNWSDVGGGGIHYSGIVTLHALGSFHDGTGPALFVGGYMSLVGSGIPVRGIARYKNGVWDDMQGGVSGGIPALFAVYDDGRGPSLFVGGNFTNAGSGAPGSLNGIAQWVGCTNQCYADCDNSSTHPRLNIDDFTCFVRKFAYGDPYVDCNQDGQRNIDDFTCFINRFAAGCE